MSAEAYFGCLIGILAIVGIVVFFTTRRKG